LTRDEQVPQVSPRIRRARLTVAARIQWPVVGPVGGGANVPLAFWRGGRAVAAAARGGHTVEQVHTTLYRGDQIRRKSDTHKITGQCSGQPRLQDVDRLVHLVLGLADGETANRYPCPGT